MASAIYTPPQLTASPNPLLDGPVAVGGAISVTLWDPQHKGMEVFVDVNDLPFGGGEFSISVQLDANGRGSGTGTVPGGFVGPILAVGYPGAQSQPVLLQ